MRKHHEETPPNQYKKKLERDTILRALVYMMQSAFSEFIEKIKIKNSQEIKTYIQKLENGEEVVLPENFPKIAQIYIAKQTVSKNKSKIQFKEKVFKNYQPKLKIYISNFFPGYYKEDKSKKEIALITYNPNPKSKSCIMIDNAKSYESMEDKTIEPVKITSNDSKAITDGHISYLHTVWERARHGCAIIGGILADHFARVYPSDVNIKTDIFYKPSKEKYKEKYLNVARFGIMSSSIFFGEKIIGASSKANRVPARRLRANKIKNIILFLLDCYANSSTVKCYLFRKEHSLKPLVKAITGWLDTIKILSNVAANKTIWNHRKNSLAQHCENINFSSPAAVALKNEFIRLLAVEYKLYGVNVTGMKELTAIPSLNLNVIESENYWGIFKNSGTATEFINRISDKKTLKTLACVSKGFYSLLRK